MFGVGGTRRFPYNKAVERHEDSYRYGHYHVSPEVSDGEAAASFIRELTFERLPVESIIHENAHYTTRRLNLRGVGDALILKHRRVVAGYPFLRKVSFCVRSWRKNYAKIAFQGAKLIREAGVSTMVPVAYWTYRRGTPWRECFFLYREVQAPVSYAELRESMPRSSSDTASVIHDILEEKLLAMVRALREEGLYHGDIYSGNILIDTQGMDVERTEEAARGWELVLLDTDHVRRLGWLSRHLFHTIIDMRSIRRLDFDRAWRKRFLMRYLDDRYREMWWWCLCFWKWWGAHPVGQARKRLLSRLGSPFKAVRLP